MPGAVSPGWEEDLPDVLSASLSLRAWTSPPAARVVPLPVASHTTAAFPSVGPGRRSPVCRTATAVRRAFRGCSPSRMCRPRGVLATQIAPPDTAVPYGSRDFSVRASRGLFPSHAPDMRTVRIGPWTVWGLAPHQRRSLVGCMRLFGGVERGMQELPHVFFRPL
jgi:hypothetical protein